MPYRAFALLLLSSPLLAQAKPPAPPQQALAAAIEQHRAAATQPWFEGHTLAREALARTRSEQAFAILLGDYKKPGLFDEDARFTIATLFGKHFAGPAWRVRLDKLRAKAKGPAGYWLWAASSAGMDARATAEELAESILAERKPERALARITALSRRGKDKVLAAMPMLLAKLPSRPSERSQWISALACALLRQGIQPGQPEAKACIREWIALLDGRISRRRGDDDRVKRTLRLLLDTRMDWDESAKWSELLAGARAPVDTSGPTRVRPRFFGIDSDGSRIVFLIDMSDSMARRYQHGRGKAARTGDSKERERSALLDESDIPWWRVHNRYDLAREHLEVALLRLDPKLEYAVVWFGSGAGLLDSTPGFVRAKDRNVQATIEELRGIGPQKTIEPGEEELGQFRGVTNMHAALRIAFELQQKARRSEDPVLGRRVFEDGCDTIFVLSDGLPNWDGFERTGEALDSYVGGGEFIDIKVGDPVTYCGPYRYERWILEDLWRLNSVRLVRVHCVGIGEADMDFLKAVSQQNFGVSLKYRPKR